MGTVDNALLSFDNPAMHRIHLWDTGNMHLLEGFVSHIQTDSRKQVVLDVCNVLFRWLIHSIDAE